MGMGPRPGERQQELWIATSRVASAPGPRGVTTLSTM
ncbi:hypothetical protein Mal4_39980 [Maioricimonas rarisocia]|uniref:Uncharacterized protein n=1 Tax=Maioricimonas rarisocia TaxID=2528026 RepID=A0A517ZAY1_9PLAN|nr:hypothetical protein Mal4_39980 [Maioricimonas rarisocia]